MKKLSIILISLLFVISLSACGKKNSTNVSKDAQVSSVAKEKEATTEELTTSNFDKESLTELIKNSDYIARVRISTSTAEGMNTAFLKDYKGDLSQIVIELPKTLTPNKEYIVFYKDDERDGSFIEIQGDKDSNLIYIEKVFDPNSYTSSLKSKK